MPPPGHCDAHACENQRLWLQLRDGTEGLCESLEKSTFQAEKEDPGGKELGLSEEVKPRDQSDGESSKMMLVTWAGIEACSFL